MHEIECLTLVEYQLGMEAYAIKKALKQEDIASQAWLNQQVQATTGSDKHPKPYYDSFKSLYDVEKIEDQIRGEFESDYVSSKSIKRNELKEIRNRWDFVQEMKERRNK